MATKEELAKEKGWVPQDEWQGDSEEWVPANEFLLRGELMGRISSQTGQIRALNSKLDQAVSKHKDLEKALRVLGEHNKKIAEIEYNKALQELRKTRSEAQAEGDHDLVAEIESKIDEVREASKTGDSVDFDSDKDDEEDDSGTQQGTYTTEQDAKNMMEWTEANPWYTEDPVLRAAADVIAANLDPTTMTSDVYLKSITQKMQEKFPEQVGKPKKARQQVHDPDPDGTNKSKAYKAKSKYTASDLPSEYKKIAETLVQTGAVASVQEYVDQFAEIGGFDDA